MGVRLMKGQKVSLTKDNAGLAKILVGIGWDINQFGTGGYQGRLAAICNSYGVDVE